MKSALPFLKAFSPKFKGEIWENARRFQLVGAGYKSMPAEQNGMFDIATAMQLRGILKALNDPDVETIIIVGATQVLKSLAGDIWAIHIVEHESDSMMIIFEDDPKAKLYVATRLMETLKQHPVVKEMISGIMEEDPNGRHRIAATRIKFANGRLLEVGGANDGMLSSLSWRFLWGSEPWQWRPGMLGKFKKRADRYDGKTAPRRKILLESQAGMADTDFALEAAAAHPVPLTWACPHCGGRQSWECPSEYSIPRPGDFVPRKPYLTAERAKNAEENYQPSTINHQLSLWHPPQPGTMAGMKIPAPEDGPNGTILTTEQRARAAKWECYHCGTLIEDNLPTRLAIAMTYEQEYRIPVLDAKGAATGRWRKPKAVCFTLPREANYTNSFESGALSYLIAKDAQAGGNEVPLENWYMSERARFYSKRLTQTRVSILTETVATDDKGHIPNEKFRSLEVDCQKDIVESLKQGKDVTGHFWWVAEATDKQGNTYTLARGYATSWEELFGRVKMKLQADGRVERVIEGGIKNKFKIPTRNVAIDGGNWFDLIKEKAAHYRTIETAQDGSGKKVWATWKVMVGDDGRGYKWEDNVWRSYWPPKNYQADVLEADGKTWLKINVPVTRWSNFAVKSILYKLRVGAPGQPKFVKCPDDAVDEKTRAKEKNDFTYDNQMNGFLLGEDAKGRPKFVELHPQQHYPDCHCMGIVLKMMAGLVRGESTPGETTAQEVRQPAAGQ
jgi:hypothetical protein